MERAILTFLIGFIYIVQYIYGFQDQPIFGYQCHDNSCHKIELDMNNSSTAVSLQVCKLLCSDTLGTVWPRPFKIEQMEPHLIHLDEKRIKFPILSKKVYNKFLSVNGKRFMRMIENKIRNKSIARSGGYSLKISISLKNDFNSTEDIPKVTLQTDESYRLDINVINKMIWANISALSIYGARHGLETLSQIIVYDDLRRELQILAKVSLYDKPAFKWRGLMLDTARNFYSIKAIKRIFDGMAMVKLNTFHWHIIDTQSFPMEIRSHPELYKLGAYSSNEVYTYADIAEVVEYGRLRGIRVVPEFDAPAHVGEGWQHTNMTVCFNAQPWNTFFVETPYGQLDPTNDNMYSVLQDIYQEMFNLFDPDVFHMGGDEVSMPCWFSSYSIQKWMNRRNWEFDETGFMRLWNYFQKKALERIDLVTDKKNIPVILWTSRLTEEPFLNNYLDNKRYFIQIWSKGTDKGVQHILQSGFHVIISNHDALYFDCGAPSWSKIGNNWCSPYIGWQKIYDNRMENIANKYIKQVLGAEAAIWSEQIDENNLDQRLWPRASALAERLWSNPSTDWRLAATRILTHREHLVENGLAAEALQPKWCLQNENNCPVIKFSMDVTLNDDFTIGNLNFIIKIILYVFLLFLFIYILAFICGAFT